MINKTPTGWTDHYERLLGEHLPQNTDVYDATIWRVSALLGPDGNPLMVSVPRQKIGFHVQKKEATK